MSQRRPANDITAEAVRALLHYDPETGVFTWRVRPPNHAKWKSLEAGRLNSKGARQISIKGREYTARRLAWLLVHGEWPAVKVEPANGDPDDLRIANLLLTKPADVPLTADRLRALLDYDTETGVFTWTAEAHSVRQHGEVAGCAKGERVLIGINGRSYFAHRLAMLHVTGQWPSAFVDHKSGKPKDNSWANLRDVSPRVNMQNQRRAHKGSSSSLLGVYWRKDRKKWQATITVDGVKQHLGLFSVESEAGTVYLEAKRRLHEGCTI